MQIHSRQQGDEEEEEEDGDGDEAGLWVYSCA